MLRELFGDRVVDDADLPLFPDINGNAIPPDILVKLVEELASITGEPLLTAAGQKRYGRHSWRSTGAVRLTSKRVELFRIQLLAR